MRGWGFVFEIKVKQVLAIEKHNLFMNSFPFLFSLFGRLLLLLTKCASLKIVIFYLESCDFSHFSFDEAP